MSERCYDLLSSTQKESKIITIKKGQNIAGFGVGILHLDNVWYPMIPGNVQNAWTYRYPVLYQAVNGLDTPTLHSGKPEVYETILASARKLEAKGCRAISSACGFFGHFQKQLADDMDIPVAVSSLVQVPWIRTMLKSNQKIGVLTANAVALNDHIFNSCGIYDTSDLVVADLRHGKDFSAIMEDRGTFDMAGIRQEVIDAAKKLVQDNPSIGAILLECSDMPPYASAIQAAVGLPVFDFITLINYLQNAVMQRPYEGWI